MIYPDHNSIAEDLALVAACLAAAAWCALRLVRVVRA